MRRPIVQYPDSVLTTSAREIASDEFSTKKLQKVVDDMAETLKHEYDGVAIAAPQIGEGLRIFVVSPNIFPEGASDELIYINPRIIKHSKKHITRDEGCLSVRWHYGKTERFEQVTVEAYTISGEKFTRGAGGLLGHIFQHEIDHLNGIVFTDHAHDVYILSTEEIQEMQKESGEKVECISTIRSPDT